MTKEVIDLATECCHLGGNQKGIDYFNNHRLKTNPEVGEIILDAFTHDPKLFRQSLLDFYVMLHPKIPEITDSVPEIPEVTDSYPVITDVISSKDKHLDPQNVWKTERIHTVSFDG